MRQLTALLLLVSLPAAGCGGEDGGRDLPDLDCPAAQKVVSADDLVDALSSLGWKSRGAYSSGVLPITPDLVIEGTVILSASALPVSDDCLSRSDCSPEAGLLVGSDLPEAVGEGDAALACADGYSRVVLADTTVRLRPYLQDTHPCAFNFTPMVEVLPACGTACAEGSRMCPLDGACYTEGGAFCRSCEGGSNEECACRGAAGPLDDGASCSYWESGDVKCTGTCRDGACDAACP